MKIMKKNKDTKENQNKKDDTKTNGNPVLGDDAFCTDCGCLCHCRETGACKNPEGCPDCGSKVDA